MAKKPTVVLVNAVKLIRKIDRMPSDFNKATRTQVKRALLNIQTGARRRARVRFGAMRNSIVHEMADDGMSGQVGSNNDYIEHHEFGTRIMSAQPMLHPAAEEEIPQFRKRLRRALEQTSRNLVFK